MKIKVTNLFFAIGFSAIATLLVHFVLGEGLHNEPYNASLVSVSCIKRSNVG